MKRAIFIIILGILNLSVIAQVKRDSTARKAIEQAFLDFPAIRTVSIDCQTNLPYDYTLKTIDGNEVEHGKLKGATTLRVATMLPVIHNKNFTLVVNGKANMYFFDNEAYDSNRPTLFDKSNYNYYQFGFAANYRLKMFNRPAMLNAIIVGDAGNNCFGQIQCVLTATVTLIQNQNTRLSLGLSAITLFNRIPGFITLNYWHKFSDKLHVDIFMPLHSYLRYRPFNQHRFSLGVSLLCDGFYITNPEKYDLPDKSYYNKVMINPEFVYEYIISRHFILTAKAGTNIYFMNGVYKSNRKGIDGDPLIKMHSKKSLFFNVGLSYNL